MHPYKYVGFEYPEYPEYPEYDGEESEDDEEDEEESDEEDEETNASKNIYFYSLLIRMGLRWYSW